MCSYQAVSSSPSPQISGRILNSYVSYFRSTMSPNFVFGITDLSTMFRRSFGAAADAVPQLLLVEGCLVRITVKPSGSFFGLKLWYSSGKSV